MEPQGIASGHLNIEINPEQDVLTGDMQGQSRARLLFPAELSRSLPLRNVTP